MDHGKPNPNPVPAIIDLPATKKEDNVPARTTARRIARFAAATALSLALILPAGSAFADAGFRNWIASFRATAEQAGVSRAVYDRAFRGITDIDPEGDADRRRQAGHPICRG